MPVHLYGSVVDMRQDKENNKKKSIFLIDDCSQAHGAIYNHKNEKT